MKLRPAWIHGARCFRWIWVWRPFGRPVVNKTGIPGRFWYQLELSFLTKSGERICARLFVKEFGSASRISC